MLHDRLHAARLLARRLARHRGERPLVLAVPRGAVPMGEVIAEALDGELDIVLVHKLGAPGNPEYAVGAVSERGDVLLRSDAAAAGLDGAAAERAAAAELRALRRRRQLVTPGRGPADVAGRTVVVVDDGAATGATLLAALRLVRAGRPRRLVVALGVAPPATVADLAAVADEVVCLEQPHWFLAVGEHYEEFRQVEDGEVVACLRRAAAHRAATAETEP